MKVFIPAAGKGTRLHPHTLHKPKALVEVAGKPMLYHLIHRLKAQGFHEMVINVHHFADQIEAYLHENNSFGVKITIADEREALLDTGGGLVNAAAYFEGESPFLVHNVDVLTNVDLRKFCALSLQHGCDLSLLVMQRATSRYLLFDDSMRLSGWENRATGERLLGREATALEPYAFAGIHWVNPAVVAQLVPEEGRKAFPVIPEYIRLCRTRVIKGILMPYSYWLDMGRPEHLATATDYLRRAKGR